MIQTTIQQVLNCRSTLDWKDLLQEKENLPWSVEEIHAKQLKIQTSLVHNYSEAVVPIEERKWNDILA